MVSLVFFEDEDDVFWCWKDFLTSCRVDKWSDLGDPLVLENQTVQIIEEIREFLKKGSVFISRIIYFSSVQSLNRVQLFATPWTAECQAFLSITNSWTSLIFRSIESVMPSSHLILCHNLLLLPPIPPSIRVFSNESTLRMRWPKYWSFSFSIIPSKEIPELISFRWTG